MRQSERPWIRFRSWTLVLRIFTLLDYSLPSLTLGYTSQLVILVLDESGLCLDTVTHKQSYYINSTLLYCASQFVHFGV